MYQLHSSEKFILESSQIFKKNSSYRKKVAKTLKLLSSNFTHPSLRHHKLGGTKHYSISVDKSIRIIFSIENNDIYLLRIGKHEDVY